MVVVTGEGDGKSKGEWGPEQERMSSSSERFCSSGPKATACIQVCWIPGSETEPAKRSGARHPPLNRATGAFYNAGQVRQGQSWRTPQPRLLVYKIVNEVPAVLMVIIVLMVVVKPF